MKTAALLINNQKCLSVRVAKGLLEKMKGLSDKENWDGTPLVFLFARPCRPAFWMHRVSFPLDIIWIARGRIVGVTREAPPASSKNLLYNLCFLKRYAPPQKIDMAVEFRAGETRRLEIQKGATVTLEF